MLEWKSVRVVTTSLSSSSSYSSSSSHLCVWFAILHNIQYTCLPDHLYSFALILCLSFSFELIRTSSHDDVTTTNVPLGNIQRTHTSPFPSWLNKDNHTVDFYSFFDLTVDSVFFFSIMNLNMYQLSLIYRLTLGNFSISKQQILMKKISHTHILCIIFIFTEYSYFAFVYIKKRVKRSVKHIQSVSIYHQKIKMCVAVETGKVKWNHLFYEAFRKINKSIRWFSHQ